MKKYILILSVFLLALPASAQAPNFDQMKKHWIDLQVAQHLGLNEWSDFGYVNNGLPGNSLTELRGVLNFYLGQPYVGAFADMSLGIMPAPKMRSFDLNRMPMPHSGTKYYLREMLSESGSGNTSAHLKMSFGLFGDIRAGNKFSVMPYFGVGFITVQDREFEMILKEDGSNMEYLAIYNWNDEDDGQQSLGYLTGRLNFKYKLSQRSSLLLGLEYMWYFHTLDFYGKFSNVFNANVEKVFKAKGKNMNMLGISVGISFR